MVFNIQFQIAGLIILLLVAALYYKRRSVWIYTDKIFGLFIATAFVSVALDIASIFTINYRAVLPGIVNEVVCKIYIYSLTWIAYVTFLYLMADLLRNNSTYSKWFKLLTAIMLAIGVAYIFLPIDYHVDAIDRSIYTLGAAVNFTYAMCIIILVITLISFFKFRTDITDYRRKPVMLIIISFLLAAILQFINNHLLIVTFSVCVSILLIYLFLENPSDKMDDETKMYNSSMLKSYVERQIICNEKYFIITSTFGITNTSKMTIAFAEHLKTLENVQLFRLGEARFAISGIANDDTFKRALNLVEKLPEQDFPVSNTTVSLDIDAYILKDSNLVESYDEAIYYINALLPLKKGIVYVDENAIEDVKHRNKIEETLKWAIENDMFTVYFQPIYSITEKRFISLEALVRLWDSDGNFLPPDSFIPIAEQNGMITEIDMMVLRKVCRFINDTDPIQYGIKFIEVNLSVVQCMQSGLASELKSVLDNFGIPFEYIHFEITETAMANSKKSLFDNMNKLIGLGSAFFLDDYGSGYANLNYLIELPFRAVKLDKELVWSYFNTKKGEIATKFAIDMLKSLDMEIVAEGIETIDQLNKMKDFHIEYIQGYYLSKPLCKEDVIQFLIEHNNAIA